MNDQTKVEVARSYSGKCNLGNFENRDVFCSVKAEVDWKDVEKVSEELYHFCVSTVRKDIAKLLNEKQNAEIINAEEDLMGVKFQTKELSEEGKEIKGAIAGKDKRESAFGEPTYWEKKLNKQ